MTRKRYGSKTTRTPRMTHTDKLNAATTWQEVASMELDDDNLEYEFVEDYSAYEGGLSYIPDYTEEQYVRYDNMADEVEKLLSHFENFVFWAIVNEDRSYRHIAEEAGCSYETIRVTYRNAQRKLQEHFE